jgi:8-oxo-dGTP pyrophosphatase MutT (NUDIX family)/phosphohistidine phosphatase SixA
MSIHLSSSGGDAGETSRIKAAGAVLWRPAGGSEPTSADVEIALIHRDRYDDWSFAKGKAEPGEHALATAVREVQEETGLRSVLGRRLPNTEYEVLGRPKRVKYWAGRVAADSAAEDAAFVPNDEVDDLEWLPAAEARERLTSPLDVHVLDGFLAAPAETFPIVLQRHGKAEHRSSEYPDDLARPLAPAGRQQATALAEPLAAYGAEDLISSPAVRCVQTVRPYSESRAVELRTDAALTELSYIHAPRAIVSWLRELADQRRGTIVCTHGPCAGPPARRTDRRGALRPLLRPGGRHGKPLAQRPAVERASRRPLDERAAVHRLCMGPALRRAQVAAGRGGSAEALGVVEAEQADAGRPPSQPRAEPSPAADSRRTF